MGCGTSKKPSGANEMSGVGPDTPHTPRVDGKEPETPGKLQASESAPSRLDPPPNIVLVMGGPGIGKGTQSKRIAEEYGYQHMSTAELLRKEVAMGSKYGNIISEAIKNDGKVPPDVTTSVLHDAIEKCQKEGHNNFVVDKFPREASNVDVFERVVNKPRFVVYYEASKEFLENKLEEVSKDHGQSDEEKEQCRERVAHFLEETIPIIENYEKNGNMFKINGEVSEEEVWDKTKLLFDAPNVVFVLGGPGSGKGTQCAKISEQFGYVHLSAGDLLRAEVASGSPNGTMIDNMIKEGKIVPGEVTIALLDKAMLKAKQEGKNDFLIDGFPRSDDNADIFQRMIGECNFVLFFEASEETLEKRLLERGKTSGRADDNIESIKKRFQTFQQQSVPVLERFGDKVKRVNAEGEVDAVFEETKKLFE